ncbi:MAG: hypothetical protein Q7S73_01875 [bacterium]|nr:hypothetical protein [bacterium]
MNKSKLLSIFLSSYLLVSVNLVLATDLYLESDLGSEVGVGQIMPVEILLDADGQNLNAAELEVIYNKNFLEPVGFKDAGSIVQFWVERPDLEKGLLTLKGIMPNGFNWQKGLMGILDFKTLTPGITEIRFGANPKIFLNDGLGTESTVSARGFKIKITGQKENVPLQESDNYLPESFEPAVVQDTNIFEGKYFLVFATQDKQSGIDRYEVQETVKNKTENGKWILAESPYLLKDQTRESYIFIKAVDRQGNERIEKVYPLSYKPWYKQPATYYIVVVLLILLVVVFRKWRGL